jgi:hypothetical protein
MEKPPEVRISSYGSADVRKGSKKLDVLEKIIRKSLGCFGVLFP